MELIGVAAVVAISFCLPSRITLFLLGVILPIDIFGSISPFALDLLRYGLALVCLIRWIPRRFEKLNWTSFATFLLVLVGATSLIRAVIETDGRLRTSLIALISVLAAFLVIRTISDDRYLLRGFVIGGFGSALDISCQYFGLPYLGATSEYGLRYSGFSFNSTTAAPFLAIAMLLCFSPYVWKAQKRVSGTTLLWMFRGVAFVVLTFAIIVSGGRGGIGGFIGAIVLVGLWNIRRWPFLVALITLVGALTVGAQWKHVSAYVTRGDAASTVGFGSGRQDLNKQAWDSFLQGNIFGVDSSQLTYLNPHTPILRFAIDAGVLGIVSAALLMAMIAVLMVIGKESTVPLVFRAIAAVMFVSSILEPTGFFVGFSKVLLLLVVFAKWDCRDIDRISHFGLDSIRFKVIKSERLSNIAFRNR